MPPSMILDLDKAEAAIRAFNNDEETLANDRLMHRNFRASGGERISVAERVVLLDKLWATQMFRRPGHARKVIDNLKKHEDELIERCRSLGNDALEHAPGEVERLARLGLPIVLGHGSSPGKKDDYAPYSFASKFLHWTSPNHFPIVDSYARAVINQIQRKRGMKPRIWAGCGYWSDDYPRWINFYSELIRSLTRQDRQRLLDADLNSQLGGDRRRNTLLRVLDKAFYWWTVEQ